MLKPLIPAAAIVLALSASGLQAKDLKSVGVTLGPLGNPFYVALAKGMQAEVKKIAPDAKVTVVSHDYDLNKEVTAIDTMIAAGTDIVFVNAADSEAIAPACPQVEPPEARVPSRPLLVSSRRQYRNGESPVTADL